MKGLLLFVFVAVAFGQVESPGSPMDASVFQNAPTPQVMPVEEVDFEAMLAEDRLAPKHEEGGQRFAYQFKVDYNLDNSGVWERLSDNTLVWRLAVSSPGALHLNFILSQYFLYPGNKLFVYNSDRSQIRGAFTEKNNKDNKMMAIAPIKGDSVVFELQIAPGSRKPSLAIGIVNHAYNGVGLFGYGDSGSCNINTICDIVQPHSDQIRSVAMILSAAGSRRCSGAMINNHRQDGRQLFLTANHCLGGESTWIFMFNYESRNCPLSSQTDGPTSDTVQGARLLDNAAESDFAIMELTEEIPASYNVFLAGFNALDERTTPYGIHHPSGDVKKYCYSEDLTISDEWSSAYRDTHWRVPRWDGPGTGPGNMGDRTTTEPGSSGSPLFDPEGRIIGQLHGGTATCSNPIDDYYGKVARSWGIGLQAVLDPDTTNQRTLDGRNL